MKYSARKVWGKLGQYAFAQRSYFFIMLRKSNLLSTTLFKIVQLIKTFSQKRPGEVGRVCLCANIVRLPHVEKAQNVSMYKNINFQFSGNVVGYCLQRHGSMIPKHRQLEQPKNRKHAYTPTYWPDHMTYSLIQTGGDSKEKIFRK